MFTLIIITLILFAVFFVALDIYLDIYLKVPKKSRILFIISGFIIIALLCTILIEYSTTPKIEDYVRGNTTTEIKYEMQDGILIEADTTYIFKSQASKEFYGTTN